MPLLIRLQIILARLAAPLVLLWERAIRVLFPALIGLALYGALALFGLWSWLGDPWRLLALAALLVFIALALRRRGRSFAWPSAKEVARRLEDDALLPGRPLEILHDHPAGQNTGPSARLWAGQQRRARLALAQLRPHQPRAMLAHMNRLGAGAAALLLLFVGFVMAGKQGGARLGEAFAPRVLLRAQTGARLEAWINAPDYAKAPPQFIKDDEAPAPIETLHGSTFHLLVRGARARPLVYVRSHGKRKHLKMQRTGPQNYRLVLPLAQSGTVVMRRPLARHWEIRARADAPPKIIFTSLPASTKTDALAFAYVAKDDVGIAAVDLQISLADDLQKTYLHPLDLLVMNARTLKDKTLLDLTRHRWAGLPVRLTLIARDGAGQESRTRPVFITLPEKLFVNPLAKAIAEQRALLVREDAAYAPMPVRKPLYAKEVQERPPFAEDDPARRLERAPQPVRRAAKMMRASLRAPTLYFDDPVVYAGLRYAAESLRLARRRDDFADLDNELWKLSLRVEGGDLADARAALKAAERAFRRALARGAKADELARLMHNYESAVQRYLQALAEDALRRGTMAQNGGGGADMNSSQLQEMLDALKALSQTGARGDARKLLQALSQLLQNMQMQLAAGSGPGNDPASEAMRKALEELGDLTAQQRELLDQLFRRQQNGETGKKADTSGKLSRQQGQLGQRLGDLADEQGKEGHKGAAGKLQQGARQMGRAAGALRGGKNDEAESAAKGALEELRQGSKALAGDLFDHIQQQKGRSAQQRDPFGRATGNGLADGSGVAVPDIIDAQRARKILQLLRDRAAQRNRSKAERDYLDRLLDQF